MQVNVSKTTPVQIDWLVASIEDISNVHLVYKPGKTCVYGNISGIDFPYQPSTDWSQAGPIIEKNISIVFRKNNGDWGAVINNEQGIQPVGEVGSTYLIAAMRCFIASKLGDIVEVPDELV